MIAMGEEDTQSGWGFDTRAVHAGQPPDPVHGAVMTPIVLASTFAQDGPGNHKGFEYSRSGNPTRQALEAPRTWRLGNAAINRVLWTPEGFSLVGWDDSAHLTGMPPDDDLAG